MLIIQSIKLSTQVSADKITLTKDVIENISSSLEKLGVYLAGFHQMCDYDAMISSIGNALDEFSNEIINAGCNEEYVRLYKRWGEFGWSFNASINEKFFLFRPNSLSDADSLMKDYCKTEEIKK